MHNKSIMLGAQEEVRESIASDGGVLLEWANNNVVIAVGSASASAVDALKSLLGFSHDLVRDVLEAAIRHPWSAHALSTPRLVDDAGARFASTYVYSDGGRATLGLVWYDSASAVTGPRDVPEEIQSRMLAAVRTHCAECVVQQP